MIHGTVLLVLVFALTIAIGCWLEAAKAQMQKTIDRLDAWNREFERLEREERKRLKREGGLRN